MGTRGFISLVIDGQIKTVYNHQDSYPEGLGVDVLSFARKLTDEETLKDARCRARALKMVDERGPVPTAEQIKMLQEYADLSVSRQRLDDWYALLRGTQGELNLILQAGYAIDAGDFPADSLFAEWGYVIDLDFLQFEVEGNREVGRGRSGQRVRPAGATARQHHRGLAARRRHQGLIRTTTVAPGW